MQTLKFTGNLINDALTHFHVVSRMLEATKPDLSQKTLLLAHVDDPEATAIAISLGDLKNSLTVGREHTGKELKGNLRDVSKSHCSIELDQAGNGIFVTDLGSRNGTYVRGEKINQRTLASNGVLIQVGSLVAAYVYLEEF
jgi:hypothetical protein